jgi:formamidopyrimidine-DNA glycosylase
VPELPEVETIKNSLEPHLKGLSFTDIKILDKKPLQNLSAAEFRQRLTGRKILRLHRRGKYLLIHLSDRENLIIHLRMTGALLWDPKSEERFTRIQFIFDNGKKMVFTDVRRFGRMYMTKKPESIIGKLGIEPLSNSFTPQYLASILKSHSSPIKSVLLNQELIAGIGNMYADEALYQAKIHPLRRAPSISLKETAVLHKAITNVLEKAIKNQGASIRNYRQPDGTAGKAHEEFAVAHRGGELCNRCGATIARIVVGQRGTYYCPSCQINK